MCKAWEEQMFFLQEKNVCTYAQKKVVGNLHFHQLYRACRYSIREVLMQIMKMQYKLYKNLTVAVVASIMQHKQPFFPSQKKIYFILLIN